MKKYKILTCLRIASQSLSKHPHFISSNKNVYMHWAFIFKDGKLIEWGMNRLGKPPIHLGYDDRIEGNPAKIHAELDAWNKAKGLLSRRDIIECVNIRLSKRGELRCSKPCVCCFNFLTSMGCKRFYYSTENGFLRTL